jgi:hypothetical protein
MSAGPNVNKRSPIRGAGRTSLDFLLQLTRRKSRQVQVVKHDIFGGAVGEVFDNADGQGRVGNCRAR